MKDNWLTVWCMRRFACRNVQLTENVIGKLAYSMCYALVAVY